MPRTFAFVVAFAALLAAAAWFAFASRTQPPPAAGGASATAPTPVAEPAAAPAVGRDDGVRRAALPSADEPEIAADALWVDVTIVDAATQQPVAGAAVDWRDVSLPRGRRPVADERQELLGRLDLFARRFGRHARSDANGRVRVAVVRTVSVFAHHEGRYGRLVVSRAAPRPPEGYRVLLRPDRTLRARVVDANGAPAAGVPVALVQHAPDGRSAQPAESRTSRGPDGIAEFAHLQDLAAPFDRVRLWIPGHDDPGVPFDRAAPPAEPVLLTLPPCGAVRMRVTWRGAAVPTTHSLSLLAGDANVDRDGNDAWQEAAGDDGFGVFAHVPVGRRYLAATWQPERFAVPFDGPAAAGQSVDVDLPVPEDVVLLTGRLLDEFRRPVADANVRVDYQSSRRSGNGLFRTDGAGRFLFGLGKRGPVTLRRFLLEAHRDGAPVLHFAAAEATLAAGLTDLGDLTPASSPLVVAGHWVPAPPRDLEIRFGVQCFDAERQQWWFVGDLATTQPGDGSFTVHGIVPSGRLRLVFPGIGHLPVAPVEFAAGERDLRVPIDTGGSLTATVRLDELPAGVLAQLRPAAGTSPAVAADEPYPDVASRYDATPRPAGAWTQFHWTGLPRGTYALSFRVWGWPDAVRTIEDVQVPGPAEGDPRLCDVDLRGAFAVLALHVDAPGGVQGGMAFAWPLAAGTAEALPFRDGVVRAAVPGPVDLVVAAEGCMPQVVRGARGELRVALAPWPEVELVFAGLPELPPGVRLHAWLEHGAREDGVRYRLLGGGTNGSNGSRSSLFAPPERPTVVTDGRARFPADDRPARLHLLLRGDGDRYGGVAIVRGATPDAIAAAPAPIAIHVPEAAVQEALRSLAQQPAAAARDR